MRAGRRIRAFVLLGQRLPGSGCHTVGRPVSTEQGDESGVIQSIQILALHQVKYIFKKGREFLLVRYTAALCSSFGAITPSVIYSEPDVLNLTYKSITLTPHE